MEVKKCSNINCAGEGMIDNENNCCPGSDDEEEMHHCKKCGEIWWEDKGLRCVLCNNFYCPIHWQATFIFLDCETATDLNLDPEAGICPPCFQERPELHCQDSNCKCSQKL